MIKEKVDFISELSHNEEWSSEFEQAWREWVREGEGSWGDLLSSQCLWCNL